MTETQIAIKVLKTLQETLRKQEIALDKLLIIDTVEFEEEIWPYLEEDMDICNDMALQIENIINFIKYPVKTNYTIKEYKQKIQKLLNKQSSESN